MKKILRILFLVLFAIGCTQTNTGTDETSEQTQLQSGGRMVFAITDAAADMDSVTKVEITIDEIQVHSATEGWVSVSSNEQTFDLLELKSQGKLELLADAELEEGIYNQVRMEISEVVITDAQGEHEAKVPSEELKINGDFNVETNSTTTATFDFQADESLHMTGNGRYILAPVVQVETKEDAQVQIEADKEVMIRGGKIKTKAKIGMGLNGTVGVGVNIPADLNLSIGVDGLIKSSSKSSAKGFLIIA